MRGTFANIRLRNLLVPGSEGTWTIHVPSGEETTIFEASERYLAEGTPLIVIAGKEYGSGSSRDWAAKGPNLLGVRAVIAESYERIHRSNLLMMGILPLQFMDGEGRESLGLTGREEFSIEGVENGEAREVTVGRTARSSGPACGWTRPASANTCSTGGSSPTCSGACSARNRIRRSAVVPVMGRGLLIALVRCRRPRRARRLERRPDTGGPAARPPRPRSGSRTVPPAAPSTAPAWPARRPGAGASCSRQTATRTPRPGR